MEPIGKIEALMQELVNDSKFYKEMFPLIKRFATSKSSVDYGHFRFILVDHKRVAPYKLNLAERSFLSELLFDHYYEELFGVADQYYRDLLYNLKPEYHRSIYKQPTTTKEKEEIKMSSIDNKKAVQEVTYVFGKDSAEMKEEDFYTIIRNLEAEIKSLESIENKPKKLVAKIEELKASIKSIVTLMDSMQ